MTDYLVAYDISTVDRPGQRRLAQVASTCEGYGRRVQHSVFECRLSPEHLQRFINALTDLIDPEVDSVIVYRFPGRLTESRTTLGRATFGTDTPWIF